MREHLPLRGAAGESSTVGVSRLEHTSTIDQLELGTPDGEFRTQRCLARR